jgi:PAS domain S-box-containing protein
LGLIIDLLHMNCSWVTLGKGTAMELNFRDLSKKSKRLFYACFILLMFTFFMDYSIDLIRPAGISSHLFIPLHLLLFAIQSIILLAVYQIYRMHRKMDAQYDIALLATKEEKAKSEAIIAAIGDGISIIDTDYRVVYQNQVHKEMMGGDYRGEYCYRVYDGLDQVCPECPVALCFEDGLIHKREKRVISDGAATDVEVTASPLRDAAGKIVAGIEVFRDVSTRKAAEKNLKERVAAMEASIDGIAVLNEAEEYIFVNQAHARIYGYDSPAELMGKTWRIFYEGKEIERFETSIMPLLAKTGKWRGEAVGRKTDGSFFPQELSLTTINNHGVICIVRDITERKRVEEEVRTLNTDLQLRASALATANRELEAFSYSLSHDLRTPLTQIYMASQNMQEMYLSKLDDTGDFLLKTINKSCENMEELIEAILELSKVTRSEVHLAMTNISGLVQEIAAELALSDPQRQVEFSIAPDIVVYADAKLLRVVLSNLLGNAWKFTRSVFPAHITFGVVEGEKKTCFVSDNGVGFDMKDAGKLFEPFQRLPGSQEYFGTGIGLATVQRVIHRHGGEIWGEGTPGKGAIFYFTLAEHSSVGPAAPEPT